MDLKFWLVLMIVLLPIVTGLRKSSLEDYRAGYRGGPHYHTKRHMLPQNNDHKKRMSTPKPRELRKKPSGHLKPLDEDDMENDEVVSVAVGPPPVRPKYDKSQWKHTPKQTNNSNTSIPATNLVRDILTQLGQEFLTHQVSEDFVFGQYIGNAMRNLTCELRLKMQHEILELVVKYQRINRGEMKIEETKLDLPTVQNFKDMRPDKNFTSNDNEESWPDFSNLAKIVGRK